jgi:uncharacterized glyoxalase superfamily protein PhnB
MNQDEFMKMYTQLVIDNYKLNKYKTEKKTNIQKIEVVLDNHIQEVEATKKTKQELLDKIAAAKLRIQQKKELLADSTGDIGRRDTNINSVEKFSKEKAQSIEFYNRVLKAFIDKLYDPKDKEEEDKKKTVADMCKKTYL